jgi:flagellar biosynthesis protein FlhG
MNSPSLQQKTPQVIAIASGKGGVGKTSVTANLAVALAARGHRVMLFDADLGLANAQLALGCRAEFNFSDVIAGLKTLPEIIVTTRQGVRLVPGASGIREMASLDALSSAAIVQAFSSLEEEVDFFIIDSAAGISESVLTFLGAAQRRFVVLCDEPSSIADAYALIKVMALEGSTDEIYLLPNMVESQAAGFTLFQRVRDVCARFLGVSVGHIHSVTADAHMVDASRARQPLLEFAPGGNGARDIRALAVAVEELPPLESTAGGLQFFFERINRRGQVPA